MDAALIERLAREAEKPVGLDSPAWRFVNVKVLAALVAEECAKVATAVCADFADLPDRPDARNFTEAIRAKFNLTTAAPPTP